MKPEIDDILLLKYPDYANCQTDDEKDDFWSDLSEKETYDINAEYLKQTGNSDYDYLVCWEPGRFDTDELVTDYPTFYEVDLKWWEFQKQAMWDSIEDCKKWMEQGSEHWTPERVAKSINDYNDEYDKYSMYFTGDWYRLIENDVFLYAQMIGAKWFFFYEAEQVLDELQEANIPYSFKGDDFLITLNEEDPEKRYDAGGREKELESYNTKIREYTSKELLPTIEKLIRKYQRVFSGKTFRRDRGYEPQDFDPFTDFIFFDEQSLKNVRTKNFLEDFKNHQVDYIEFQPIIDELKEIINSDFERIYNANRSRFLQQ